MAAVAQLSPIAVDASVLVIVGAGLPGGGRPSFTTADLADRPAAVQAAFDAEWGREVGSEALNVLIRANRERALAPERLGAAPVAIATTVTDAVLNTRRRCALPALYLRGHGMGRRCLTCGTRWSPIGIGVTPGECCLVDSRPAIALDDE